MPIQLRRIAAIALTALGVWLLWGALDAILAFTSRGGSLSSALFEPPTSILRVLSTSLIILGGALAAFGLPRGATIGLIGTLLFAALGGLMAMTGADLSLWLDEVLFATAALGLVVFILTLARR